MMYRNYLNYTLFIVLTLLWSGSFLGIKVVVTHFPPFFSAMLRVVIAQACLLLYFFFAKKPMLAPFALCWRLWIVGIFSLGFPFAFLFYGEQTVQPALASIINSTVSIWALLLGIFLLRDYKSLTVIKISGLILGLIGVALIFGPLLYQTGKHSSLMGTLAVLAMALSYAIGALLNQHWVAVKLRPAFSVSITQQFFAGIFLLLLFSILFDPMPAWQDFASLSVCGAFIYLGVFSTAIAWVIYYHLICAWDAIRASSAMYMVPLLAIMWDYLFLGLKPGNYEFIGMFCILLGVIFIQVPIKKILKTIH